MKNEIIIQGITIGELDYICTLHALQAEFTQNGVVVTRA